MLIVTNKTEPLSKETIFETWQPLLEKEGVPQFLQRVVAEYCHFHSLNESQSPSPFHVSENEQFKSTSTLPLAIRILKKLNLEGKNVQVTAGPTFTCINTQTEGVHFGQIENFEVSSTIVNSPTGDRIDLSVVEEVLANKAAELLNFNLKKHNTIVLYNLATSVCVISEATMAPKILLRIRVTFLEPLDIEESLYEVLEENPDSYVANRIDIVNAGMFKVWDSTGNIYYANSATGTYVKALCESDVLKFAAEIEAKAATLLASASNLRRTISNP